MTETAARQPLARKTRTTARSVVWFGWMEAMWGAFFALLLAGQLDAVWSWVRDLPVVAEIVMWVAFFPWLVATAVWGSSWAGWIRLLLVVVFAIGWSAASVPRPEPARPGRPEVKADR